MQGSGGPSGGDGVNVQSMRLSSRRQRMPIFLYKLKDLAINITTSHNFFNTMLVLAAFVSLVTAFPFYPLVMIIILLILLFAIGMYHSFPAYALLMLLTMPVVIYQAPALGWVFLFLISLSLIYGYMHHRMLVFLYIIVLAAFSPIGYFVEVLAIALTILMTGFRRSAVVLVLAVLSIVAISGVIGVSNHAYISYGISSAHKALTSNPITQYIYGNEPALTLSNFAPNVGKAYDEFVNSNVTNNISSAFFILLEPLAYNVSSYLTELAVLLLMAFIIDTVASSMRQKYKGTISSAISIAYPIAFIGIDKFFSVKINIHYLYIPLAVAIALIALYLLELFNIEIVKVLDIKKADIRMKFGEAFEDLAEGEASETFKSVANYEHTKEELRAAIIAPIEERGISRAYNVQPVRGVLFFGPPGTGKTLMMRALSHEIHGYFYYVKAANLLSAYPGETERMISNIFAIAKKHRPCVLFFDEIDSITSKRELSTDDTRKAVLSQLLIEIDGFQKLDRVIVVGATNAPDLIDEAILRPGRMDKLVYMPPPSYDARKKIFEMYLKKLPIAEDVNIDELASKTERYTGADIKAICESVSQKVAHEAAMQHKILEIEQADILESLKHIKASTTLSQIDKYNKFKVDMERMEYEEIPQEKTTEVTLDDVKGLDDAKKAIKESIELPLMHPELMKKYDVKAINGILLFGPPGTGKTMLLKAIMNEWKGNINVVDLNASDIIKAGFDKASTTIKDVFYKARENVPSVIFIDEMDSLVPKRATSSEFSLQITTEILKGMDGLRNMPGVIVVGTTNRPNSLDDAVLRPGRIDKIIFVRPPNDHERMLIFEEYLIKVPGSGTIDYEKLASITKGFTGADISNVCREVKTHALEDAVKNGAEAEVTTDNIIKIIKAFKPSAPEDTISEYLRFLARYGER